MGTIIKTQEDAELLRESGRRLSLALDAVAAAVRPGVSTKELDRIAEGMIRSRGDEPAFLGYSPEGATTPFPASLCISVNDEIVHGIPSETRILQEGDIVGLDLGVNHGGMITDSARTVPVGKISYEAQKLLDVTKEALERAIAVAVPGGNIGDIGFVIQSFVMPFGYSIVRELGGHGVGHHVHEEPYIANFGNQGTGPKIVPGMVLAIEPMLNAGGRYLTVDEDGYTIRTADGSLSAHFEHTILVGEDGAQVMTQSVSDTQ
ncbi:MAG TPA: type I methionyl aminopeptidase [Candidatus Paceibacterota bacterium]|nr:type I methionyl aminopeptidase [Candidatus Paceibacterota bacterium]